MMRKQTFTVTVEMPLKDSCGAFTHVLTAGDIRRALWKQLPCETRTVIVSEGAIKFEEETK